MQAESRIVHSLRNISTGLVAQVVTMVAGFVSRTIFVNFLAIEYLGLNSLFANVLSMLSLAELGIGAAFMYALYKPIADADQGAIAAILGYYRKLYTAVGLFIFCTGLALIPFLDYIVNGKPAAVTEDLRIIFLFFLANTAITYLFSYKVAVLQAAQRTSIATINTTFFTLVQHIMQILILVYTANFLLYLFVQFVCNLGANLSISRIVDNQYPYLKSGVTQTISPEVKQSILGNVKATFLTKIGGVLVNGTDNLIINYFVGLALLGKFSNYVLLITLATNFLVVIFNNANASIAHVVVKENIQKQKDIFTVVNFANFLIYGFCALCFVALSNDFIALWIGPQYLLSTDVVVMLAINFFMVGMQNAFWVFKSSFGIFRQGRYVVLITAALNLCLSFVFGAYMGIFGVLLATALARLATNFWYDPYLVLTTGLKQRPYAYFLKLGLYFLLLAVCFFVNSVIASYLGCGTMGIIALKLLLCFVVYAGLILLIFLNRKELVLLRELMQNAVNLRKG